MGIYFDNTVLQFPFETFILNVSLYGNLTKWLSQGMGITVCLDFGFLSVLLRISHELAPARSSIILSGTSPV